MTERRDASLFSSRFLRLLALGLLLTALIAAGYWYYWPLYHEKAELARAQQAFAAGNLAEADEILEPLTKQHPQNMRAHFLYAQVLRRLERFRDADYHLGRAGELGLPKEEGRREFGLLYAGYRFSEARGALEQELAAHPDDLEVIQALAGGWANNKYWNRAEIYYDRWLQLEPERLDAWLSRGQMYLEAQEYQKAAADFQHVLQLNPDHFTARLFLAHSWLSESRWQQAEVELVRCQQMRPESPEPLIDLAVCAKERQDYVKANSLLTRALSLDPGSLMALNDLGDLQMLRKDYKEAVKTFRLIIQYNPRNKQGHLKLAQALRYLGKEDEAREQETLYQKLDEAEQKESQKKKNMR